VTFQWDDGARVEMTQQEDPTAQWIGTFDANELAPGTHDLTVEAVGSATGSYTIEVVVTGDVLVPEPEPEPNPDEPSVPDMGGGGDADAGEVPTPDADTPDRGGPTEDVATAPDADEDAVNVDFSVVADGAGHSADEPGGESTSTADDGCGCQTSNPSAPVPLFLLAVLLVALRGRTRLSHGHLPYCNPCSTEISSNSPSSVSERYSIARLSSFR
jgi:MYXO-CTERM domain-containing protein